MSKTNQKAGAAIILSESKGVSIPKYAPLNKVYIEKVVDIVREYLDSEV